MGFNDSARSYIFRVTPPTYNGLVEASHYG